jgi:hypothetical protein
MASALYLMFSPPCLFNWACDHSLAAFVAFSQDLAFLVGAGMLVLFLALSGGFVPFSYIEDWIAWMQWVSPVKYSFQSFSRSLVGHTSAEKILETLDLNKPSSVGSNISVLICFFALSAVGAAIALSRQKEVR